MVAGIHRAMLRFVDCLRYPIVVVVTTWAIAVATDVVVVAITAPRFLLLALMFRSFKI